MACAGVNLRVEDIPHFRAACQQGGLDPASVPVLAILHDDDEHLLADSFRQFAGLDVRLWRCMSPNSQLVLRGPADGGLPLGAHVVAWNEADEAQDWWDAWWKQARAQRPDLKLHYGAPNVDNQWPLNAALLAELDVQDVHIGSTFSPPTPAIAGKPVWVTEIDIDPSRFTITGGPYPWGSSTDQAAAYSELLECMRRCLAAGQSVFAWGIQSYAPEVAYDVATLGVIAQLNRQASPVPAPQPAPTPVPTPQGGTTVAGTIEDRVTALEQRDADITKALNLILKGQYTGADGAAGQVVALQGGTDDLTGNVKVPTFS